MKLIELRDIIDSIIKENPSWADCERIGTVISKDEDGFCEMEWIKDFKPICCDGQGMVAFQIVLEDDYYYDLV